MLKIKRFFAVAVFSAVAVLGMGILSGCPGSESRSTLPYPDEWQQQKTTATSSSDTKADGVDEIRYFLDKSNSTGYAEEEILDINSCLTRTSVSNKKEYYIFDSDTGKIVKTDLLRFLAKSKSYGAVLDDIEDICYNKDGVNVISTDLQANASGVQIGKWLTETGCTGYSFYVFRTDYNGKLEFKTYLDGVKKKISVSDCKLPNKYFLVMIFGNDKKVKDFDADFQNIVDTSTLKDKHNKDYFYHISMTDNDEETYRLSFSSSKCFEKNIAKVKFDNTNYCYGIAHKEEEDKKFADGNVFVYEKNKYSASEKKNAVKAVLYALPENNTPDIETEATVRTMKYDNDASKYVESSVKFDVKVDIHTKDTTVSDNDDEPFALKSSEDDEDLNEKLGGNIVAVPNGKYITVSIANSDLPEGLYSIEIALKYHKETSLSSFSAPYSATVKDYENALNTECKAKPLKNNTYSDTEYEYVANSSYRTQSAFNRLLDFNRVTDELTEYDGDKYTTLSVVIDNRSNTEKKEYDKKMKLAEKEAEKTTQQTTEKNNK